MLQRIPGPEPGYLFIDARVWRLRGAADCDEPEVVDRLIEVNFLFEGPTSVMSDRELLVVDVEPPPLVSCGQGGSRCDLDCQCEGDERCLSFSDGGRPETACARPCELDRDCLGDGPCASLPTGLESVCDSGSPECTGTRPCPAGFACRSGQCEPEFVLDGNTRHACSCDSQCDFPLRCAFGFDQTEGRCDIICPTGGPGWCQGSNVCGTPFETGSESVCGWNGAE
jgi:hypothetical protein